MFGQEESILSFIFLTIFNLYLDYPGVENFIVPGFLVGIKSGPDITETENQPTDVVANGSPQGRPYKRQLLVIAPYDFHAEHFHAKRLTIATPEVSKIEKLE
jgi:hypothetical protein